MPAMNNILSKWVPVSERSRSLALVYSGMYLGSVTGLAFSPILIHQFGWPSVFYSFGSLGTVWFSVWLSKVWFEFVQLFPLWSCLHIELRNTCSSIFLIEVLFFFVLKLILYNEFSDNIYFVSEKITCIGRVFSLFECSFFLWLWEL